MSKPQTVADVLNERKHEKPAEEEKKKTGITAFQCCARDPVLLALPSRGHCFSYA